jgi:hypothetical protein
MLPCTDTIWYDCFLLLISFSIFIQPRESWLPVYLYPALAPCLATACIHIPLPIGLQAQRLLKLFLLQLQHLRNVSTEQALNKCPLHFISRKNFSPYTSAVGGRRAQTYAKKYLKISLISESEWDKIPKKKTLPKNKLDWLCGAFHAFGFFFSRL